MPTGEERHAGFLASPRTAPVAREAQKSHHIIVTPQSKRLACRASQQVSGQLPARGLTSYSHRPPSSCYHNSSSQHSQNSRRNGPSALPLGHLLSIPVTAPTARLLVQSRLLRKENPSRREQAAPARRRHAARRSPRGELALPGASWAPSEAQRCPRWPPGPRRATPGSQPDARAHGPDAM